DVAAEMERVRRTEDIADTVRIDGTDEIDGRPVQLDEVIRMSLEIESDAFALEDRQQLLHRSPELRLAARRGLRTAVELGVHRRAAYIHGKLDRPFPVPYGGLPLVLVRSRPTGQRAD